MYFLSQASDYLVVRLAVEEFPDRFSIDGGNSFINATLGGLDPDNAMNGDWEWDNANSEIKYVGKFSSAEEYILYFFGYKMGFFLPKQSQRSRSVLKDRSRTLGLFMNG